MKVQPPTDAALDQWLADAKGGDRLVYWRGDMAADLINPSIPLAKRSALKRARDALQTAFLEGQVLLTQERVGEFDRLYIATRRSRPGRPALTTA